MTRVQGYYRFPTIHGDSIVFTSEDDLWIVNTKGGVARRLTAGLGHCHFARFSPDGETLAFTAQEEGHPEAYVMPAQGGPAVRLTYLGSDVSWVAGWSNDGEEVLFVSDAKSPFMRHTEVFQVDAAGGMPKPLRIGHAVSISINKTGATVIGRNNHDPARWKRYRGGTAGELWIDANGKGNFKPLIKLKGNMASPMWIGSRVYFLSDHEGIGNIYSCKPDGSDLQRHTKNDEYYVRHPSTDGSRIVYTAGSSLFVLDTKSGAIEQLNVEIAATPRQAVRKFIDGQDYLEHISVHPKGHSIGLISRGQPFSMPFWEEAVTQHGAGSKARYRHLEWLPDGEHFLVVNDLSHYERLELHKADQTEKPHFVSEGDIGRVVQLVVAPVGRKAAFSNHKHELVLLDIEKKKTKVLDRSPADRIYGVAWSPDARWIAYSYAPYPNALQIRIFDTKNGEIHDVTRPLRSDMAPAFDPEGNYLYFLSAREFNPIYDAMNFDLSFPYGVRPYLVTLRKDVPSPFVAKVKPLIETGPEEKKEDADASGKTEKGTKRKNKKDKQTATASAAATDHASSNGKAEPAKAIQIDFEGIQDRILAFPVEDGRYHQIAGANGRALFTQLPLQTIKRNWNWRWEDFSGNLLAYDFAEQRAGTLFDGVVEFQMSQDARTLVYLSAGKLRVVDAATTIPEGGPQRPSDEASRKSGWIDLARISVLIQPYEEWSQMFHETWRLQREHFWDESMSDVDWDLVYKRYSALLPRINARTELSDLIWEMQGELGTSHAYESGGDHRQPPAYHRGFLGAELEYDNKSSGYKISKILRGDSWDPESDSPLSQPGLGIREGDIIIGIGGRPTSKSCSVDELLMNASGKDVMITIVGGSDKKTRRVPVKAMRDEKYLRYRAWVESNRKYVHQKTNGRVGYLHIPDMGPWGYAEFHRNYLSEIHREGLVVDVRYNRGGHVSPLLLEKLARKRVGYDVSRWGSPMPYPPESVAGPLVAITNQFAGSDGDIFSHCFKLYKLGPLVGKRTWGGVIGIWPRHSLVDGTMTTQPEFSFWFVDAGFGVENYGTDPDYEVDFAPQDYREKRDPQMDKALELINGSLKKNPFKLPNFDSRPSLPLPPLNKPAVAKTAVGKAPAKKQPAKKQPAKKPVSTKR
jgi:tricorn protease